MRYEVVFADYNIACDAYIAWFADGFLLNMSVIDFIVATARKTKRISSLEEFKKEAPKIRKKQDIEQFGEIWLVLYEHELEESRRGIR